jgi:hypothetical protein
LWPGFWHGLVFQVLWVKGRENSVNCALEHLLENSIFGVEIINKVVLLMGLLIQ